jgi:hypothetical protein
MSKNNSVLIISDLHAPFFHKDTIQFLGAIKKFFKPDRVILTGDEVDHHNISFHDSDPDLLFSASSELQSAIDNLKPIYDLFPTADIMESNHGSLAYRRAKAHGLPRHLLKDYRDVLDAPKGWKWHPELVIKLSDGRQCYFTHGKSASGLKLSQAMGMSVVQGHYHNTFDINYWANPNDIYWAMTVGCMIDNKSLAFAYNKLIVKRPLIGCGIILDGQPKLLPMVLDKNGNWIGKVV